MRLCLLISLLLTLTTGCATGQKLDRATALKLAKDRGIPGDVPSVVVDTQHYYVGISQFGPNSGLSEEMKAQINRQQQSNLEFYRLLKDKGILTEVPCERSNNSPGAPACFFPSPKQPDVRITDGAWFQRGLVFYLTRPTVVSVTGITQQGVEAEADVMYEETETNLFQISRPIVGLMHQKYPDLEKLFKIRYEFKGDSGISVPADHPVWVNWPTALNKVTAWHRYHFKKYDDGWRIEY